MSIALKITTSFGVTCGTVMQCQLCGTGRVYDVSVTSSDMVSIIWDKLHEQNPDFKIKNVSGALIRKGEILDIERRIIFYDMKSGDELLLNLAPTNCCTSSFRKAPKPEAEGAGGAKKDEGGDVEKGKEDKGGESD